MEYNTRSAKITASSDDNKWGGCFAENRLWILLEVETKDDSPASHIGKSILDLLLVRFSTNRHKNATLVDELLKEAQGNSAVITLIIGYLSEDNLYLGSLGQATVLIKRNGRIGRLLQGAGTSQGKVIKDDVFIFHSDKLEYVLNSKTKTSIFIRQSLEELEEEIASNILGNDQALGTAVLAFKTTSTKESASLPQNNENELSFIDKLKGIKISQVKDKLSSLLDSSIDQRQQKKRKKILGLASILVLILIFSVVYNLQSTGKKQKQRRLSEVLELVNQQYDEGVSLIDLNPVRARELLTSSKLSIAGLLKETKKNSKEHKMLSDWLNKISTSEVAAYKIYKLTAVPLFFDINLVKPGGEVTAVSAYKESKILLDTNNKALYILSTDTKKAAVLAGSDVVGNAKTVAIHGGNAYLINNDGISSIDIKNKSAKVVIEPDEKWGDIIHLKAFGGNLYLMDKKNNTIWKYIATDFGFSSIKSYLNPDVNVNFDDALQMSIDGSIWVPNGQDIYKFTSGQPEQFALKGFSDTIEHIDGFYTSDDEDNFYILDKSLARIVVFDKDGFYQSQYQWEGLKDANDIVVTEAEGKIFVLSKSKIYAIEIK